VRIIFCGTAAAEGIPCAFCTCRVCREAARLGGKDLRTRFSIQVGERLRVDWPPDSHAHMLRHGFDYDRLDWLFISHDHWDHCAADELILPRRPGFAHHSDKLLHVFGPPSVLAHFNVRLTIEELALALHPVKPGVSIELEDGLAVTPIPADHQHDRPASDAVNFIVEGPRFSLLSAHDTGWYGDATWETLRGRKLTHASVDCTSGKLDNRHGHLGVAGVIEFVEKLASVGALAPGAKVFANHFSHNGLLLHEELVERLEPRGIAVAYDGLELEV
jgi:phosphoribosyl 1,2-cyclic phosphate phosphodiesterase